ncbi:MAG: porin family protein [Bacteroidales bacterium]|nr:porin family protein [Bacteroidales bacterium]
MKKITGFILSTWIAALFMLPPVQSYAQTTLPTKKSGSYWYINANSGTSIFYGDIKTKGLFPVVRDGHSEWRMGGGLQLGWQISPVFGLRGQGLYGQLSGIKTSLDQFFQADYLEFNLNATVSLMNLISGYKSGRKWNVYLLGGVGLTNYNSTAYKLSDLSLVGRMGYGYGHGIGKRTLEGIVTGGLGVSYQVNDKWSLQFETANRVANSDAMDLWVNNYKYDVYNYTSLGVSFRFGQSHSKKTPASQNNTIPLLDTHLKKPAGQKPPVTTPAAADTTQKTVAQPKKEIQPVRTILPVKPILEYRVQIRARYGKPVSTEYLSKKYNIPEMQIRMNMHNGYYIYTVGSYDTYMQARTRRDQLKTQNGVYDAFVVAFKNGRRLDKLPK